MATAASVDEREWGEDGVVRAKIQTFSTLHFPTVPCRVLWKWAKDWRKILFLNYADNNVSDEEFVPLYDCYRSKNRFQSYVVFYLENMNSADCQTEFRVQKADPLAFQMPCIFPQCSIANWEAFVMVWRDCVCCWDEDVILTDSAIWFNVLQDHFLFWVWLQMQSWISSIYDNHCHLVTEWNRDILSSVALQQYAETISRKGSLPNNCFDFVDAPEIFIASNFSIRKSTSILSA